MHLIRLRMREEKETVIGWYCENCIEEQIDNEVLRNYNEMPHWWKEQNKCDQCGSRGSFHYDYVITRGIKLFICEKCNLKNNEDISKIIIEDKEAFKKFNENRNRLRHLKNRELALEKLNGYIPGFTRESY